MCGKLVTVAVQGDFGKPRPESGLRQPSQIMVDKAVTLRRDKLGLAFGRIEAETLLEVERCLAVFLGIAK